MRVSCDFDSHNVLKLIYFLAKGSIMCRRFPYMVRKTRRGFHYGWRSMQISENESYKRRLRCGDDVKRIHLDMSCPKKPKQVLFSHKEIYVHEFDAFGNYIGKKRVQ